MYTDTNGVTVVSPSATVTVSPQDSTWSAHGSYLVDVVSAASVDIVSSASPRWSEARHQASLGAAHQLSPRSQISVDAAISREPDYLSLGSGARMRWEPGRRQLNPAFGYWLAHDTAGRAGTPFSIYAKSLTVHALSLGLEAIIDRSTVLFLELDGTLELGDSAKPYRFLPLFAPDVAARVRPGASLATVNLLRLPGRIDEHVPQRRLRSAAFARLSRRFARSTFVATQRLYLDDWGLAATTSSLRSLRELGPRFSVWLDARWHIQSGVSFWQRAYSSSLTAGGVLVPRYRSGDRELSALWVTTLGAGARYGLGPSAAPSRTNLSLQVEESATRFLDALYLEKRWSHLVLLQLEGEL